VITPKVGLRIALASAAALLLAVPAANAEDTYSAAWNGGELLVTADDDFTEATIQRLTATGEDCETNPEETSCTWELTATLHSDPATRCDPSTPDSQVAWTSGPQSGNGTIEVGPEAFALEGCPGQTLTLTYRFERTYEALPGTEPPLLRITGGGGTWPVLTFGRHPGEEAEAAIVAASPPAEPRPFEPNFTPRRLRIAADRDALTIGTTRYVFLFRQMGCRKATDLAQAAYRGGGPPEGYRCAARPGEGRRCWRQGRPARFLEWHLPRRPGATGAPAT
jgi:hypothetical protein